MTENTISTACVSFSATPSITVVSGDLFNKVNPIDFVTLLKKHETRNTYFRVIAKPLLGDNYSEEFVESLIGQANNMSENVTWSDIVENIGNCRANYIRGQYNDALRKYEEALSNEKQKTQQLEEQIANLRGEFEKSLLYIRQLEEDRKKSNFMEVSYPPPVVTETNNNQFIAHGGGQPVPSQKGVFGSLFSCIDPCVQHFTPAMTEPIINKLQQQNIGYDNLNKFLHSSRDLLSEINKKKIEQGQCSAICNSTKQRCTLRSIPGCMYCGKHIYFNNNNYNISNNNNLFPIE